MSNIYKLLSCFERDGKEETPGTPVSLVNDMLDKLPSEIWSDPSKKFLDPACSTGTFLLEIVRRLNKGLAQKIPNQEDRLRHIVENMVYGAEVYQVPYLMTRRAFSRLFNYKFNLFHGNMVEGIEGLSSMKFDVVVMNPPYNGTRKNLYKDFMLDAMQKIQPEHLLCVTPNRFLLAPDFADLRTEIENFSQEVILSDAGRPWDSVKLPVVVSYLRKKDSNSRQLKVDWLSGLNSVVAKVDLNHKAPRLDPVRARPKLKNKEERDSLPPVADEEHTKCYFVNSLGSHNNPFRYMKEADDTFFSKIVATEFVGTGKTKTRRGSVHVDAEGSFGLGTDSIISIASDDKRRLQTLKVYFESTLMDSVLSEICSSSHVNQTMRLLPDPSLDAVFDTNEDVWNYFGLSESEHRG